MNNWLYLLQWMLMVVMVSMSYEMSTPSAQVDQSSVAAISKQTQNPSNGRSERVKRFAKLPPATQEKVLAYGENLLRYLEEETPTPS